MLVYRVEDENGLGPYAGLKSVSFAAGGYLNTDRHPSPYQDPLLAYRIDAVCDKLDREKWVFGFDSLASYGNWFHTALSRSLLDGYGFRLAVYDVADEHCFVGQFQVIFDPKMATRIDTVSVVQDHMPDEEYDPWGEFWAD